MKEKPYKAKSLAAAQREVRSLRKAIAETYRPLLDRYAADRKILARLAAKGPTFFSPLEVFAAEKLRDDLLRNMGMNPDGTFIKPPAVASAAGKGAER